MYVACTYQRDKSCFFYFSVCLSVTFYYQRYYQITCSVNTLVGWLVVFNITFSHISAIKLQYSCPVSNLYLLSGIQCHGKLGVSSLPSLLWHRHRKIRRLLNLLFITGPTGGEGIPGIKPRFDTQSSPLPLCHCGGLKHSSKIWLKILDFILILM